MRTVARVTCWPRCAGGAREAHGVEPRGAAALRAIEHGCSVTIVEASEYVASRPDGSAGGLVLSGVVDRLPLHALLPLLAQSRRVLQRGAPLVVISEPVSATAARDAPAEDLVDGRPLHEVMGAVVGLLAGFVEVVPLPDGTGAIRK